MRLLVIGNLIAIIVLTAYKQRSDKKRPTMLYLLGKSFQSIGWLLLSLRGEILLVLSGHIANTLLLVGFSLEMLAFSRLSEVRQKLELLFLASTATGSMLLWVIPELNLWVTIISIAVVCIYAPTAIVLLRQENSSNLQKVISACFLLFCSMLIIRAYSALVDGIGLFSISTIQSLTFISLFGFSLVGGIGFLLLMNEKLENELFEAATTDSLTGILNRRAFFSRSEFALNIAIRNQTPISIIMLDIDYFKKINDSYGHYIGDIVLQSFTRNICQQIRPHDVFGRIGGEEFAILILNSNENTATIAERIRASTETQDIDSVKGLRYTVSIGIASCIPKDVSDLSKVLQKSDVALYEAKNSGRNKIISQT